MWKRSTFSLTAVSALLALGLASSDAGAYMIDSAATYGCHERWAQSALDSVGYVKPPPPPAGDEQRLFDAVEFNTSFLDRNLYALSLVLGSRSVDLAGYSSLDLTGLISLHNDPSDQASHCLRGADDDYEAGDAAAVETCRDAIRGELMLAFGAADFSGLPDPDVTEEVEVYLLYQGPRNVPVSRFYFHLGRALHTLEDSFSHAYRTEDRTGIVEVMNWIEAAAEELDADRDGPAHDGEADECRCDQPWAQATYRAVEEAGSRLVALAGQALTAQEREAEIEAFLDQWVYHVPGCTGANAYCASPDPGALEEADCDACAVALVGDRGEESKAAYLFLLAIGTLLILPRRK